MSDTLTTIDVARILSSNPPAAWIEKLSFARASLLGVELNGTGGGPSDYEIVTFDAMSKLISVLSEFDECSPDAGHGAYLIRCTQSGLTKIGYSRSVSSRMKQLQACSGSRLELLGVVRGGAEVEHHLHGLFAHLRRHGEWFHLDDTDVDLILQGAA